MPVRECVEFADDRQTHSLQSSDGEGEARLYL